MIRECSTEEALSKLVQRMKINVERLIENPNDKLAAENLRRIIKLFFEVKKGKTKVYE